MKVLIPILIGLLVAWCRGSAGDKAADAKVVEAAIRTKIFKDREELSGVATLYIQELPCACRVFLSGPSVVRDVWPAIEQ